MSDVYRAFNELKETLEGITKHQGPVVIVGAAKDQPPDRIEEGIQAGLRHIANNYVQQGMSLQKILRPRFSTITWHFIGHIQSRKVRQLVDYDVVQSLDRLSIAISLNERLQQVSRTLRVFVQVNIGREPQKSGIAPEELEAFLTQLSGLSHLRVEGLMAMPPALEPVELRRAHFASLRELFDRYRKAFSLTHLSMGTSADYKIAVEEGSTMIRLGASLFGARN